MTEGKEKTQIHTETGLHLLVCSKKCPQQLGLGQADVKNQELHPGLPGEWENPHIWDVICCLRHISSKLDRKQRKVLEPRHSYMHSVVPNDNFTLCNSTPTSAFFSYFAVSCFSRSLMSQMQRTQCLLLTECALASYHNYQGRSWSRISCGQTND